MTTAGAFTLDYKSLTILEKQVRYRLGLGFLFVFLPIHHFHKDHDAPCLPPALKFCVPVLWMLQHADCHRHNPLYAQNKRLSVIQPPFLLKVFQQRSLWGQHIEEVTI